jgi:maltose O-acetyltransferase
MTSTNGHVPADGRGWRSRALVTRTRRRVLAKVRGYQELDRLVAQGLRVGQNVWIARSTGFDDGFLWLISIGDNSTIAGGVSILAHDASTKRHLGHTIIGRVTIGHRVYIGHGTIVLPCTTIGDDSIIGAGSIVKGTIPPKSVVVGNPARVVGTTEEYIERHRAQMSNRPVYPTEGCTVPGGIAEETMVRMREELRDGVGYI